MNKYEVMGVVGEGMFPVGDATTLQCQNVCMHCNTKLSHLLVLL